LGGRKEKGGGREGRRGEGSKKKSYNILYNILYINR